MTVVSRCHVQYEHIRVQGSPFERGKQYGQKAADKIRKNVAHYLEPGQLPPWKTVTEYVHKCYIPALKKHYSSGLEELKGIATGAGVTLEEIVMVNARYDLARVPGGSRYRPRQGESTAPVEAATNGTDDANECTSGAFLPPTTTENNVIVAQNWDISGYLYTDDLVILLEIHPDPSEGIPSMFVVTEAGQMGRSGMNSLGMAVAANSLNCSQDFGPDIKNGKDAPCLPIAILRRLYLESPSYPKGLQAIANAPRHVSSNLLLGTAEGFAMDLELTPHEAFVSLPNDGEKHIVHSNHWLHPQFKARPRSEVYDTYPGGSSWYRNRRFLEGIKPHLNGGVNVSTLKQAFSDHLGYPQSVCQHVDNSGGKGLPGYPFKGSMTLACIVYDCTKRVVTTCKGQPCVGVFESYKLDA